MSQVFHPAANSIARISIVAGALAAAGGLTLLMFVIPRSSYVTKQYEEREQPIPFYHAHHVGSMGIDCRYCHSTAEKAATAGIPPTKTCMNCHAQIWNQSPTLEPVRESFRSGTPIEWVRVHDLPDFVYFNHSAHVNKGVGCTTCHGRVDEMSYIRQEKSLLMEWCLDCHRAPEKSLRPKSAIYNVRYEPPADQLELGQQLAREYDARPQVSCSTCHR